MIWTQKCVPIRKRSLEKQREECVGEGGATSRDNVTHSQRVSSWRRQWCTLLSGTIRKRPTWCPAREGEQRLSASHQDRRLRHTARRFSSNNWPTGSILGHAVTGEASHWPGLKVTWNGGSRLAGGGGKGGHGTSFVASRCTADGSSNKMSTIDILCGRAGEWWGAHTFQTGGQASNFLQNLAEKSFWQTGLSSWSYHCIESQLSLRVLSSHYCLCNSLLSNLSFSLPCLLHRDNFNVQKSQRNLIFNLRIYS